MELREVTSDSALHGKSCRSKTCRRRFKVGDPVVIHYQVTRGDSLGEWLAWHADCVQQVLDSAKPKVASQAEIDAFVARERARILARSV